MNRAQDREAKARAICARLVAASGELAELCRGDVDCIDWFATDVREGARAVVDRMHDIASGRADAADDEPVEEASVEFVVDRYEL